MGVDRVRDGLLEKAPLAPPQGSSRIHLVDPEELRRILQKVSGFSEKGGFRWGFAECCARRGGFRRGLQESVFPRGGFRWGFADTCRVRGGFRWALQDSTGSMGGI